MSEEERCENRKSDVTSLGRKLKLHLLVYMIDNRYIDDLPHAILFNSSLYLFLP